MKRNTIQAKVLSVIMAATVVFSAAPVIAAPTAEKGTANNIATVQVEEVYDSNIVDDTVDDSVLPENQANDYETEYPLADSVSSNQTTESPNAKGSIFKPGGAWEHDHTDVKEDYSEAEEQALFNELEDRGVNVVRDGDVVHGETESIYDSVYDPRALGKVTSIKDQGQWGLCWDYSAISTIESSLIYKGITGPAVDLSELHTAYFLYKILEYDYQGFEDFCNKGGSALNVIKLAMLGIGPVTEEKVPMGIISDATTVDPSLMYDHAYELDTAYEIGDLSPENMSIAKQLIQETGGLMASYYSSEFNYKDDVGVNDDTTFYNAAWESYDRTNHAIEIVGWDDNFSRDNFSDHIEFVYNDRYYSYDFEKPAGDGAWLVKNSWGYRNYYDSAPASGYLWISYYEGSLSSHSSYAVEFAQNGTVIKDLSIANTNLALRPGESAGLEVDLTPTTAIRKIKFEALNNKVTVDANGVVTGLDYGQGLVNVSALKNSEINKTATINVYSDSISLVPDLKIGTTLKKGDIKTALVPYFGNGKSAYSYGVLNSSFSWSSSNPKVADVTQNGSIVAKNNGVTNIKVTFTNPVYTNNRTLSASYQIIVGAPKSFSKDGASYKINSDGTYTYAKAPTTSDSVTVPSSVKVQGLKVKVTKIGKEAFKNNKKIKKVVIPSTIVSVGDKAFYGCKNLKSITFKTSKLKSVGKSAFAKINKKAVIKVPKSKKSKYGNLFKGKMQKGVKVK